MQTPQPRFITVHCYFLLTLVHVYYISLHSDLNISKTGEVLKQAQLPFFLECQVSVIYYPSPYSYTKTHTSYPHFIDRKSEAQKSDFPIAL